MQSTFETMCSGHVAGDETGERNRDDEQIEHAPGAVKEVPHPAINNPVQGIAIIARTPHRSSVAQVHLPLCTFSIDPLLEI
jgi:hypothetical protein